MVGDAGGARGAIKNTSVRSGSGIVRAASCSVGGDRCRIIHVFSGGESVGSLVRRGVSTGGGRIFG